MANITEVSEFTAAVPELATNTQAIGGPGGAMNSQAQALANRTKYLKDERDKETVAGRALVEAADADAQRTLLNVENGADVTDEANVTAIAVATDEVTAAPAHWWVLVAGALKRMTHAGWTALVLAATGKTNAATGFTLAGGTTSKTLTVSADADTANIPTADEKTRLSDIQAATGATTALKLANLTSPATPTQQGVALLGASGGALKLTKMPDGATAVYSNETFADVTGFSIVGGSVAVVNGEYVMTAASGTSRIVRNVNIPAGGYVVLRVKNISSNGRVRLANDDESVIFYDSIINPTAGTYTVVVARTPVAITSLRIFGSYLFLGNWALDWLWIGDYSYLTGSLSEEAARIANLRGDMPGVGQYASQTITASTTTLPTATKGDTIGGKKYTFVAALTASPGVEGEVLIDASGGDDATKCKNTLENLNLALSEAARTNNGTLYWAAAVHPLVSSARVNEVLTLTAKTKNGQENNITVVCEAGTNHTAGGATLLGGYTDSAAKTIAEVQNNIAGNGTRPAAAKIELTNTALIGYETTVDVAKDATLTLPAGGTWYWNVYSYGATIGSAKRGSSAGGTTLTVAGANASVGYRRVA